MNNYKIDHVICKICGYETNNRQSFNSHIAHAHHIKSKEYYDMYIKTVNEGLCIKCGKPTAFIDMWKGYRTYCCNSCMSSSKEIQERRKQTSMLHYGTEFPHQSQEIKDKTKNTHLKLFGAENVFASEYGKKKIKETLQNKYGVDNIIHIHEFRCKMAKSRLKNGNHSSLEDYFEQKLIENNIQYRKSYDEDIRYPYKCDFYLIESDTFIEINNYWVHNTHFYTGNEEDLNIVEQWKQKGTDHYMKAIHIWTISDVEKRDCAIKNNINYVVLWNKNDINNYLSNLVHFH